MLYSCESWPLRVEDQRRLKAFDNYCLSPFWVAVVKTVFCAPPFVIDSIFERCLRCLFSVDFVGLGMLRDVLLVKVLVRSTPSIQLIGIRSVVANSKRGWPP